MTNATIILLTWMFILLIIAPPAAACLSIWCGRAARTAGDYIDEGGWKFCSRIFAVGTVVAPLVGLMLTFWLFNAIQSEGIQYETDLNSQYVQNVNNLSTYVLSFEEQLGVANLQESQIKAIITEAVAGQTNVQDLVAPGKSPLYAAVSQAYPKVTLEQYTALMTYIQQGRDQFQQGQASLLTELSAYDHWQHAGLLVQPGIISALGFPTKILRVQVGGKSYTGADAEAQMWRIVENPVATTAFATGVERPLVSK